MVEDRGDDNDVRDRILRLEERIEELTEVIERGSDQAFQRTTAGALRGRERGPLEVAGPTDLDPAREYLVAGTDWELEPYGGMVDADWQLQARYDFPTILREAIEEHLRA